MKREGEIHNMSVTTKLNH